MGESILTEQHGASPEFCKVFNELDRELVFVFNAWNYWKRLFATDEETVDLLKAAGCHCFGIFRGAVLDDVILAVCRMTDPSGLGRHKNLTLESLALALEQKDPLWKKLDPLVEKAKHSRNQLREHRNKRIAHLDMSTRLEKSLPKLPLREIDAALRAIAAALDAVREHYATARPPYEDDASLLFEQIPGGTADDLVDFLKRKQELEEYFDENPPSKIDRLTRRLLQLEGREAQGETG